MSYDLYFWRQTKDFQKSPELVLDLLSEDEPVKGIIAFPRDQVRHALREAFPDIKDQDFDLTWEGPGGAFQVGFGHASEHEINLVVVYCEENLKPQFVSRLVDTLVKMGFALYDPREEKRFVQPETRLIGDRMVVD